MVKIGAFLIGSKGLAVLDATIQYEGDITLEFVVLSKNNESEKGDNQKIFETCIKHNIPTYYRGDTLPKVDYKIASGWKWIIKDYQNLIVIHDSILPQLRGFNPTITALISKHHEIGATAFWAEQEYDTGNIITQTKHQISYPFKIKEAVNLVLLDYKTITSTILESITSQSINKGIPQKESDATYSLWLDEEDYRINWNQSAENISRFIDSVGDPYKGALAKYEDEEIRVLSSEIIADKVIENRQPGKVFNLIGNNPIIVCKTGLLQITHAINSKGETLYFTKLKTRFL